MKHPEPTAAEILTGVTSTPRASAVREHTPGNFPPSVESRIRELVRAGMDRKMAEEIGQRDFHRETFLAQGNIEAMTAQLPALRRLAASLDEYSGMPTLTDQQAGLQQGLRLEAGELLTLTNVIAERYFKPVLEAKLIAARDQVKDFTGGDAARAAEMSEHHFDVVRIREFLRYLDCSGNPAERRLALAIEFFAEAVAAASTPAAGASSDQ